MKSKIIVHLSKTQPGRPGRSVTAACSIELIPERAGPWPHEEDLQDLLARLYDLCNNAVENELATQWDSSSARAAEHSAGVPVVLERRPTPWPQAVPRPTEPRRPSGPVRMDQLDRMVHLTWGRGIDMEGMLRKEYGIERLDDLSAADAEAFLRRLEAEFGPNPFPPG